MCVCVYSIPTSSALYSIILLSGMWTLTSLRLPGAYLQRSQPWRGPTMPSGTPCSRSFLSLTTVTKQCCTSWKRNTAILTGKLLIAHQTFVCKYFVHALSGMNLLLLPAHTMEGGAMKTHCDSPPSCPSIPRQWPTDGRCTWTGYGESCPTRAGERSYVSTLIPVRF